MQPYLEKTVFSDGVKIILECAGCLVVRIPDLHCRDPGSIWITRVDIKSSDQCH